MVDDVELDVIDSWRFLNDMPSRASAMRELIRRGLAEEGFEPGHLGGVVSEKCGVVHSPPML
jgi:hypothetical protein